MKFTARYHLYKKILKHTHIIHIFFHRYLLICLITKQVDWEALYSEECGGRNWTKDEEQQQKTKVQHCSPYIQQGEWEAKSRESRASPLWSPFLLRNPVGEVVPNTIQDVATAMV